MRTRYSAGEDGKLVKKAVIYTRDEHGINFADVDGEAVSIVKKLKSAGFATYIVGGAVRDLILGKKPKDFDIASSASPTRIKKIFRNSRIIGRRFRLVHVYFGQRIFEVSTFRSIKEGYTNNSFGTIEEDVLRRDFTMNALFYDPEQQIVVDYIDGMNDIKNKQVKPVIPLNQIFTDDPVRMIRAVKYAATTGFTLPLKLKMKIKKQSALLSSISPSRLTEEIFKIIHSNQASEIVDLLDKMGLYCYLQPKAAKLMKENPAFKQSYLKRMASLNGIDAYRGQVLGSLFYDYLETLSDWKSGDRVRVIENYKEIFQSARSFVLPMNPPRFEMEHSVRKFFASRGITIKRSQTPHAEKSPSVNKANPVHTAKKDGAEGTASAKRRRRRKRKPAELQVAAVSPQPIQ